MPTATNAVFVVVYGATTAVVRCHCHFYLSCCCSCWLHHSIESCHHVALSSAMGRVGLPGAPGFGYPGGTLPRPIPRESLDLLVSIECFSNASMSLVHPSCTHLTYTATEKLVFPRGDTERAVFASQNSSSISGINSVPNAMLLPPTNLSLSINSGSWIHDSATDAPLVPVDKSSAYPCRLCCRLVPSASASSPTIQAMLQRAQVAWAQCSAEFETCVSKTMCPGTVCLSPCLFVFVRVSVRAHVRLSE